MLTVYSKSITTRLRYACDLVFGNLLGIKYRLTSSADELRQSEAPLSYSETPLADELFLQAAPLLFQKGLKKQEINISEHERVKVFFLTGEKSALPYDPLAASFYMVTRYEEYLPYIRDEYGRFHPWESLAFKAGFLEQPVVNLWALQLRDAIKRKYPGLKIKGPRYEYIPTIDVDSAFAYTGKGFIRTLGGYLKSLQDFNGREVVERSRVLAGVKKDPYDTFDHLVEIHNEHNLSPVYFILVGDYDEYDKNVSVRTVNFQSLIKSIGDYAEVGMHPSFASNNDFRRMKRESEQLAGVLKREIRKSRQHFLMLRMPGTYQNLIDLDITDDYTMGFAAQPGFRAGIASTYKFYNLDQEAITDLKIHPFAIMDATLNRYMKLSPEAALHKIAALNKAVRDVNGTFITVWHNNSLSEDKEWMGWRHVYYETLKIASA